MKEERRRWGLGKRGRPADSLSPIRTSFLPLARSPAQDLTDASKDAESREVMLRRLKSAEPFLMKRKQRLEADLAMAERDAAVRRRPPFALSLGPSFFCRPPGLLGP